MFYILPCGVVEVVVVTGMVVVVEVGAAVGVSIVSVRYEFI